jgi:hypothetical protein
LTAIKLLAPAKLPRLKREKRMKSEKKEKNSHGYTSQALQACYALIPYQSQVAALPYHDTAAT